jgi:tetratricopeptide (TPR) repeat protein
LLRPELIVDEEGDTPLVLEATSAGQGYQGRGYNLLCYVVGDVTADPVIRRLTDAVQVVKAAAARPQPDFEAVARSYRAEAVKPELPESARRWRVQAESAVRAQRFDEAADLFDAALLEAPWWPEGHFNRALVLGEAGDPAGAITEMRRYLALVPEAPDARAAQDKIYEWEGQVTAPAPAAPAAAPRR